MKHGPSLEDERRALLEHIHASRAAYRRMLTEIDEEYEAQATHHLHAMADDPGFPRSMTMRWIIQHPYATAGAVAGTVAVVALAAPRIARVVERRRAMKAGRAAGLAGSFDTPMAHAPVVSQGYDREGRPVGYDAQGRPVAFVPSYLQPAVHSPVQAGSQQARLLVLGRAAITSLATAAMMILRDPAKMRMAMRLFTTASDYVRRRRANDQTLERHAAGHYPAKYP
jgi:hypothetical protein